MAVPTHFRFVIRGSFKNSPEHWSTSCHFTRQVSGASDATLGDIDESAVTAACDSFFGGNLFGNHIVRDDWRFYEIGTDNKMVGNGPLLHTYAPNQSGGGTDSWKMPAQVACAITLVAVNRGPAKFGRMYLPTPNVVLGDDGRLTDSVAGTIQSAATNFLKAVSDSIDLQLTISSSGCNVSPGPAGSSSGTIQNIDHMEVGRVLDTIRNRRKSMDEARFVGGHIDW